MLQLNLFDSVHNYVILSETILAFAIYSLTLYKIVRRRRRIALGKSTQRQSLANTTAAQSRGSVNIAEAKNDIKLFASSVIIFLFYLGKMIVDWAPVTLIRNDFISMTDIQRLLIDLFTLMNPISMLLCSGLSRRMFVHCMHCRKYHF